MKTCSSIILACLMTAGAERAAAADLGGLPPARIAEPEEVYTPALRWTGLYLGANAGYSFGRDGTRETSAIPYNGMNFEHFGSHAQGFTGGGQVGYNYQTGRVVLGIEADFNYANLTRSATSPSGAVTAGGTGGFVGSVRPRLGLAWGQWLLYGTGGVAFGTADSTTTGNTGNTFTASNSDWRVGWVAGMGVEYAFNRNWSVRTELLHTNLGATTVSGVALDGNAYSWRDHITENAVRFGVNYRF